MVQELSAETNPGVQELEAGGGGQETVRVCGDITGTVQGATKIPRAA